MFHKKYMIKIEYSNADDESPAVICQEDKSKKSL